MQNKLMNFIKKVQFIFTRKLKRIKNNIKKEPYTQNQKEIFDQVEIGEVIYAEMPFNDSILYDIPQGHRVRPYIVVKKDIDNLICYPASHKKPNHNNPWRTFKLSKSRNKLHYRKGKEVETLTDSYFDLYKPSTITIDKIIGFFMTPVQGEDQRLERQLTILKNNRIDVYLTNIEFQIREGDLLKLKDTLAFIYSVHKKDIFAHPAYSKIIEKDRTNYIPVLFGQKTYYIKINEQLKINPQDRNKLMNAVEWTVFNKFEIDKKRKKDKNKNAKAINKKLHNLKYRIGQVFINPRTKDKLIYLYNIENAIYGVSKDDIEKRIYQIRRLKNLCQYEREEVLSKEDLKLLIRHLLPADSMGVLNTVARIAKIQLY